MIIISTFTTVLCFCWSSKLNSFGADVEWICVVETWKCNIDMNQAWINPCDFIVERHNLRPLSDWIFQNRKLLQELSDHGMYLILLTDFPRIGEYSLTDVFSIYLNCIHNRLVSSWIAANHMGALLNLEWFALCTWTLMKLTHMHVCWAILIFRP